MIRMMHSLFLFSLLMIAAGTAAHSSPEHMLFRHLSNRNNSESHHDDDDHDHDNDSCDHDCDVAACSANPRCHDLGLTGDCCPGMNGNYLDCCYEQDNTCYENRQCRRLGLEGACCPTANGVFLDCCKSDTNNDPASCIKNSQCRQKGLNQGFCCPTEDGVYLDCCLNTDLPRTAKCMNNAKCADLGLEGFCCPTAVNSIYLDCCDVEPEDEDSCDECYYESTQYELAALGYDETVSKDSVPSSADGLRHYAAAVLALSVMVGVVGV